MFYTTKILNYQNIFIKINFNEFIYYIENQSNFMLLKLNKIFL